jgi:hypothetical protein
MNLEIIGKSVSLLFLLWLGYILLKEGLHYETPKEKMIKATARPLPKKVPKRYSIFLGTLCFFGALYFAFKILWGS